MTLNANSNPAYVAIQAFLGPADESHETVVDFESSSITGAAVLKYVANIPATTTISVSLSTVFAAASSPQFMCAFDATTSPGQNFGINYSGAGGPFSMVAAASAWGYPCDGSALPSTVYLYNPNTSAGVVVLGCITN